MPTHLIRHPARSAALAMLLAAAALAATGCDHRNGDPPTPKTTSPGMSQTTPAPLPSDTPSTSGMPDRPASAPRL